MLSTVLELVGIALGVLGVAVVFGPGWALIAAGVSLATLGIALNRPPRPPA